MEPVFDHPKQSDSAFAVVAARVFDSDRGVEIHVGEAFEADAGFADFRAFFAGSNSSFMIISYIRLNSSLEAGACLRVQLVRLGPSRLGGRWLTARIVTTRTQPRKSLHSGCTPARAGIV